jgi:hypothetical protein
MSETLPAPAVRKRAVTVWLSLDERRRLEEAVLELRSAGQVANFHTVIKGLLDYLPMYVDTALSAHQRRGIL